MGPSRAIWGCMGLCGAMWGCEGLYGAVKGHMGTAGGCGLAPTSLAAIGVTGESW